MRATTNNGTLNNINFCSLYIPSAGTIFLNNLPDVSDNKSAVYDSTPIMGRSSPLHTYHYSNTRTIQITFHFFTLSNDDITKNLNYLSALQSCVYPREGNDTMPFIPPVICRFKCGLLLGTDELNMICESCNVQFSTDTVWDENTLLPYKVDVSTTWWVVYSNNDLPSAEQIVKSRR